MQHELGRPIHVPMDPRIRQRRVEVRRRQGRRRLRLLLAALLVLLLTVGAWLATRSSLLDVDVVKVHGAERTPPAEVVKASRIGAGQGMLDIDPSGASRRVERLPWVATAEVRRDWPGTVRITLVERTPAAVTRADGEQWLLLDDSGRVLEAAPSAPVGLPVLEGLMPAASPGSELEGADAPLAVVTALTPSLRARTRAVAVVEGATLELRLNPRGTVRLGPAEDLEAKLRAAETVLAQVDVRNLAVLDVRYPSSPVLTRD